MCAVAVSFVGRNLCVVVVVVFEIEIVCQGWRGKVRMCAETVLLAKNPFLSEQFVFGVRARVCVCVLNYE